MSKLMVHRFYTFAGRILLVYMNSREGLYGCFEENFSLRQLRKGFRKVGGCRRVISTNVPSMGSNFFIRTGQDISMRGGRSKNGCN